MVSRMINICSEGHIRTDNAKRHVRKKNCSSLLSFFLMLFLLHQQPLHFFSVHTRKHSEQPFLLAFKRTVCNFCHKGSPNLNNENIRCSVMIFWSSVGSLISPVCHHGRWTFLWCESGRHAHEWDIVLKFYSCHSLKYHLVFSVSPPRGDKIEVQLPLELQISLDLIVGNIWDNKSTQLKIHMCQYCIVQFYTLCV